AANRPARFLREFVWPTERKNGSTALRTGISGARSNPLPAQGTTITLRPSNPQASSNSPRIVSEIVKIRWALNLLRRAPSAMKALYLRECPSLIFTYAKSLMNENDLTPGEWSGIRPSKDTKAP